MCWAPVVVDCLGQPELAVTYLHQVAMVVIVGWTLCSLEDPPMVEYGMCPVYLFESPGSRVESSSPCLDAPGPRPGELLILRTTAVDSAGNEDCG